MRTDKLLDVAMALLLAFTSGVGLSMWLQGHKDLVLYMSACMLVMAVNRAAYLLEKG